jgi:hypothetical protein
MSKAKELADAICRIDTLTEYQRELIAQAAAELRRLAALEQAAEPVRAVPDCRVAYRRFTFDAERQHHIPEVLVAFEPVPVGAPNDAKGWTDREAFVNMLSAAPQPARKPMTDEQITD